MTSANQAHMAAIAAIVIELLILIMVSYARMIQCTWCRAPFAVYQRTCGDLCPSCAKIFDDRRAKIGRRRSLLQRIRRAA